MEFNEENCYKNMIGINLPPIRNLARVEGNMAKRIADWLEKFSVLAAGIGVFQGRILGLFIAAVSLGISLWITKIIKKGE